MRTETAVSVLALHEVEEADLHGVIVLLDDRRQASELAGVAEGAGESGPGRDEILERRSLRLLRDVRVAACVREVVDGVERPLRGAWLVAAVAAAAFLAGFLTQQLGGGKVVNLLSIPLLGLVVWNVMVYVVWGGLELRGWWAGSDGVMSGHGGLGAWLNRWLLRGAGVRLDRQEAGAAGGRAEGAAGVVAVARRRFWEKWIGVLRARAAVWVELAFHAGAVALAAGLVAGLYARGLSSEYKAAWESTFLEAPAVSTVLRTTLGPAAGLVGRVIPEGAAMQRLNIHDQEKLAAAERESAAGWIHLYALTALIFIGAPRLGLMIWLRRRARRIERQCPLEGSVSEVWSVLVRQAGGAGLPVQVLPFASEPEAARLVDLRQVLQRVWPDAGAVTVRPVVAYGDEDEAVEALDWPGGAVGGRLPATARLVVLMSLSATPEREVHGELVRGLEKLAARARRDDQGVLAVVLDARAFRRQFDGLPEAERRLRERRAAWEKIIEGAMEAAFSEEGDFFVWRRVGAGRLAG